MLTIRCRVLGDHSRALFPQKALTADGRAISRDGGLALARVQLRFRNGPVFWEFRRHQHQGKANARREFLLF